jgi:hypothetical protein
MCVQPSLRHTQLTRHALAQENDTSSLYFIVRSLMQLQRTYGTITNVKGTARTPVVVAI